MTWWTEAWRGSGDLRSSSNSRLWCLVEKAVLRKRNRAQRITGKVRENLLLYNFVEGKEDARMRSLDRAFFLLRILLKLVLYLWIYYTKMIKSTDCLDSKPSTCSLVLWLWVSYLTSFSVSFHPCKISVIVGCKELIHVQCLEQFLARLGNT